ncbi:tripartite tricarboxylate transporter permease [Sulfitobacter aestuarii]|uniref:Tripartite tricarboxylate transporter permease n=1 Tax=Sulfitobacter aestuarii TaxID=2161676 RepID=A0ABW5U569_9RHOB
MFENVLLGLQTLADPALLLAVLLGVVGGVVIGALPGLTSTMGVALLIPVTFSLPPQVGLAMLGGIYCASTYSGAISAILLNIPGTSASVATMLDGHPMAKSGKPGRAISLATFASCIGGMISIVALLFLAPQLAEFSLRFGSPEYFLLAVFGITVIASMSAGAMEKGLIAGALGLILSTVGVHPLTGTMRFTGGVPSLYDGIPLVVALIGLYSIPEVIDLIERAKSSRDSARGVDRTSHWESLRELAAQKYNVLRASLIGIVVGIVPGVGCSVGGFLAYDAAKRGSKTPEAFGKGSSEGLIASETGNNAVTGGTLIPLLTLGIPGNPVTAVLLGGIMIHGLRPGPELFTTNADVTYGFIFSLFLSNLLFVPIGLLLARYGLRIVQVPAGILAPIILTLAVIGAYSLRASLDDIWIMLAIGGLGWGMAALAVPRAPLVLGLVLGTLAEGELARSLALVRGDLAAFGMQILTRPVSLIILLLCIIAIVHGINQHRQNSKMLE